MTERNGREQDANLREEWMTAEQAAVILSVSVRTVQKRAREGKLPSRLEGRRLLVGVMVRDSDAKVRESASEVRESGGRGEFRHDDSERIADLKAEIQFLRDELAKRNQAEGELRRLMLADRSELAELRQQVRLLQAAPSEPPPADTPPDDSTGISEREREAGIYQDGHDGNAPITGVSDRLRTGRKHAWWQIWKR